MADLRAQYRTLEPEIKAALHDVLDKCHFILGENVTTLETEVAEYCGAKYGISVASGTDALTISLAALGIGPGDEVITTPFTFVATNEAIALVGATPVYADIDPVTFNIDPASIKKVITSKTKAILPVHLYGQCANVDEIEKMAEEHGLNVVYDGAQAIGAAYRGRKVGEMGDATTLSFFPTKNLGGYGDGGMILTNNESVLENAKSLRFHGMSSSYTYKRIGFCSRLDEIQAAILRVKLSRLQSWNDARRSHAAMYNQALIGSSIIPPTEEPGNHHIYHQYTMRTTNRAAVQASLKESGVDSAIYYPSALHIQEAYSFLGYKEGDFEESERATREVLSVPVHPELTPEQVQIVAEALAKAAREV